MWSRVYRNVKRVLQYRTRVDESVVPRVSPLVVFLDCGLAILTIGLGLCVNRKIGNVGHGSHGPLRIVGEYAVAEPR